MNSESSRRTPAGAPDESLINDGLELLRAFQKIASPEDREAIIILTRSLSRGELEGSDKPGLLRTLLLSQKA